MKVDWNALWKKYYPKLSPKEAHAELMQRFPELAELDFGYKQDVEVKE